MASKKRKSSKAADVSAATWIGKPTHMVGDEAYYAGFERDGEAIRVGDVVLLDAGPKVAIKKIRDGVYVAEIESLWEDCYGEKWAECRWCVHELLLGLLGRRDSSIKVLSPFLVSFLRKHHILCGYLGI
jgi:hypothetical protein